MSEFFDVSAGCINGVYIIEIQIRQKVNGANSNEDTDIKVLFPFLWHNLNILKTKYIHRNEVRKNTIYPENINPLLST